MADFENVLFPLAKFHFRMTVDGEQISFQEITGLSSEIEPLEYRHGDSQNFFKIKGAGMLKYENIEAKKGVFQDDDRLFEIFNRVYDKDYYTDYESRMDLLAELLNESGETVMAWNAVNAFPVKLTATDLKSDGNEVAIEGLSWAHEQVLTSLA